MTHPAYIKEKARRLRLEKGLTIDEIAERLAISRQTIYHWLRDLPPLGKTERRTAAQLRAAAANARRAREKREAAYAVGAAEFGALARDPTFRDFVCMYIGEGSKRCRNLVAICNSDPNVIRLAAYWIRRFARNSIRYSVQHHADQDLAGVAAFWSEVLEVEPDAIQFQRKSNSGQLEGRNWRSAHGVLAIRAPDTAFRARLQAWMDLVRAQWLAFG